MDSHTFKCIDAHTCGNPVRLVTDGYPKLSDLHGETMSEKRQYFIKHYDWIRQALMFEPRGHAMMSGSIIYPPCSDNADCSILYIETSGCLPMCGHGTIGTVTAGLEYGLIKPKKLGELIIDVPAGQIKIEYKYKQELNQYSNRIKITSVKIYNVPSYLAHRDIKISVPNLGELYIDIAYGGNFYAIVDIQKNYAGFGLDNFDVNKILYYSPIIRNILNNPKTNVQCIHPEDHNINSVTHILWAGQPTLKPNLKPNYQLPHAKSIVFYGSSAIDRSPCGTGTSARMAQWAAKDKLKVGDDFINESIIGSIFNGHVEATTKVGKYKAIVPSIEGWAMVTGLNTIFVNQEDQYAHGFQVV